MTETRREKKLKTKEAPHNKQKIPLESIIAISIGGIWDLTVYQLLSTFAEWQEKEQ